MKYAVEQRYYDSGHVSVKILTCDDSAESFSEERSPYDLYYDVFDTLEEAEAFAKDCQDA